MGRPCSPKPKSAVSSETMSGSRFPARGSARSTRRHGRSPCDRQLPATPAGSIFGRTRRRHGDRGRSRRLSGGFSACPSASPATDRRPPSPGRQAILDFTRHALAHYRKLIELLRGIGLVLPFSKLPILGGLGAQIGDKLHGQPPPA